MLEIVIGVSMALVMHHALRGKGLVRASILVPWAIPTAVSAIMWQFIFQADGVANEVLSSQILWTTEGFQAKIAVIIADVWKTAPFVGLLVLAGLQIISERRLRGGQGRRRVRRGSSSGGSRCRWSSRRCWWRSCSAASTRCACSTCRS